MHRHHPRQRGLHDQSLLLVVCAVTTAIVTIITSIPFVQAQQAAAINVVVDCSTNQIIVAFDGIMNGNDDWIGLYRESALAGTFPNLPDHALELYEDWFTTCQTKDVCPFWHRSGQVVFDLQADLERSAELRVVLGQGESTETVAVSNVFRVDEVCAVGGGVADDTAGADTAGADDTNTDNIDDILLAVQECHDDLQDLIENDLPLIGMVRTNNKQNSLHVFLFCFFCAFCTACFVLSHLKRLRYSTMVFLTNQCILSPSTNLLYDRVPHTSKRRNERTNERYSHSCFDSSFMTVWVDVMGVLTCRTLTMAGWTVPSVPCNRLWIYTGLVVYQGRTFGCCLDWSHRR